MVKVSPTLTGETGSVQKTPAASVVPREVKAAGAVRAELPVVGDRRVASYQPE